jgi:hypothetical protein
MRTVQLFGAFNHSKANHLKTGLFYFGFQMVGHFFQPFETRSGILMAPENWSGFQWLDHLETRPIFKWYLKASPNFKCLDHLKTSFQIPTVQ